MYPQGVRRRWSKKGRQAEALTGATLETAPTAAAAPSADRNRRREIGFFIGLILLIFDGRCVAFIRAIHLCCGYCKISAHRLLSKICPELSKSGCPASRPGKIVEFVLDFIHFVTTFPLYHNYVLSTKFLYSDLFINPNFKLFS